MRILVDGEVFGHTQTGVAKVTRGLYAALVRRNPMLEVRFACRHGSVPAALPGVLSISVPPAIPARLWRRAIVPALCLRHRPDVIHYPWNGRVGPFLSPLVITTIHDVLPLTIPGYFADERQESRYRKSMNRDITRSDVIVTDSEFSRGEIERHFHPAIETVVVSPATDIGKTPDHGDVQGLEGYFLYVGGYDPRKGVEELLRVFHEGHSTRRLRHRLLLVGEPRHVTDECARLIREGIDSGMVEEKGYVDEVQLAALYRHATALVYPSRYEGFGLPPLEAMSLGCPVLTTAGTSLREVCGDAALYIDPADPATFLENLCALEGDGAIRRALVSRGLDQARRFSWDESADRFLSLLIAHVH